MYQDFTARNQNINNWLRKKYKKDINDKCDSKVTEN